ncbi:hypothetical protein [Rubrobacter indicoceani]|uniref:hypothetical protein n=1 Tax=Rubrobacter indicoceani TaxID=2051957 RepID=UPI000E5B31F0|nr:hypothetical protein [Rubrobacter indicoceani]
MLDVFTLLAVAITLCAVLSAVGLVVAFRAWLSYRRVRAAFQSEVVEEVSRLSVRTTELERGVNNLSVRASELPFRLAELQQSIAVLQTLTGSLAVTLRQTTRVLNFSSLKTLSATKLGKAVGQVFDRNTR